MRVAFYAPMKSPLSERPSGDRQIARLLLAALRVGGHTTCVASNFCSRDSYGDPTRQQRLASLGAQLSARLVKRLTAKPSGEQPEAWLTYHLYHKAPDWLGPPVSAALGIPYFVVEASSAPKQAHGKWRHGHAAARAAICQADRILTLNPNDTPEILRLIGNAGRIVGLAPFLESGPFTIANRRRDSLRNDLQRQLGLPPDHVILLAVGMFRRGDKQASFDVLARALTGLVDESWSLVIVGNGPNRAQVHSAFSGLPTGRVQFLGAKRHDELPSIYAAADLLVWPAIREAIGMSILESQAAGTPVAAGSAGAVPTIVTHMETGLLSPAGDAEGLADNIRALTQSQGMRRRMGAAAIEKVSQHHTVASAAATLNTALEDARTAA